MGFTHREFLKCLPAAVAPFRVERRAERVYRLHRPDDAGDAGQQVALTLKPETRRAIAAIALPVTGVRLEFFGFSAAGFENFMGRYKRYLHKAGG